MMWVATLGRFLTLKLHFFFSVSVNKLWNCFDLKNGMKQCSITVSMWHRRHPCASSWSALVTPPSVLPSCSGSRIQPDKKNVCVMSPLFFYTVVRSEGRRIWQCSPPAWVALSAVFCWQTEWGEARAESNALVSSVQWQWSLFFPSSYILAM